MTIPTISTLPVAPARTDAPATFITRADAFLAALVTMQSELNTSIGAMNTDIAQANADATAAAASASAAATSESNASTSETNAATSETNAASSAAAAASTYDQFDDRYLGSKASDPAVDNDGNALLTGALYFNSTSDDMKVYTGTTWKVTGFNPDSPTFTDTVTAPSFDINSIAETKADTAVDVFVYDTRKDSDGGAWRKRTQNTSWYNETLNTATRGSRREFPAVAVIVATGPRVHIYDGDDPSLPMWMEFTSNGPFQGSGSNIRCVSMLNGILLGGNSGGLGYIDFIKERLGRVHSVNTANVGLFPINVAERTTLTTGLGTYWGYNIVDFDINDVAMTVLPNAPIDAATGLPVPTIAVGTAGGVSVIKDDGTVVDITTSIIKRVTFDSLNNVYALIDSGAAEAIYGFEVPASDQAGGNPNIYRFNNQNWSSDSQWTPALMLGSIDPVAFDQTLSFGCDNALLLTDKNSDATDADTNFQAVITSDYNTGWMNGDIKLATLSDTDATNITGSELVTNGTFNTDVSGWTASTATITYDSGVAVTNRNNATFFQQPRAPIALQAGQTYTFSCDVTTGPSSGSALIVITNPSASDNVSDQILLASGLTGTISGTVTAPTTDTYYVMIGVSGVSVASASFDNVSVRLAVEDRSVNDKGLQVFGTITKNLVATGADLVAYTGWSGIQYLEQPYNSDLQFGTGDFSIMYWINTPDNYATIVDNRSADNSTGWGLFTTAFGSTSRPYLILAGQQAQSIELPQMVSGIWTHIVAQRAGAVVQFYLNGALVSTASTIDWSTVGVSKADTAPMRIGVRNDGSQNLTGSLSLLRISATAATAEQIAKVYEDEKFLFQDNAQATLYGTSDAVTALAYDGDTELLHVGTSAGRSVFSGLRRVDNTTGAVGAAISASNGLVAED